MNNLNEKKEKRGWEERREDDSQDNLNEYL